MHAKVAGLCVVIGLFFVGSRHVNVSGISRRLAAWRAYLLQQAFELLYGPLVLFHEPLGRTISGASWHGRRRNVLQRLPGSWTIIDIGSGAGHLLTEAERTGFDVVGVEPSKAMRRLSDRRGMVAREGRAQALPVESASADAVVATYPGPWILDPETWSEFARVLKPGGRAIVLLGGTVERGRGSRIRRALQRIAYGSADDISDHPSLQRLGHLDIPGNIEVVDDRWGKAFLWVGRRR
jgi:SAM-dependent methyltransferase